MIKKRAFVLLGSVFVTVAALWAPLNLVAQTAADPQAVWAALAQPTFDPAKVAAVSNITLQRDLVKIILQEGRLGFAQPVEGRVFAAAFKGRGRLTYGPQLPLERQQVAFHLGAPEVAVEFTEAVFIFADKTFEEISRQVQFAPGDPSELQKLYRDRQQKPAQYDMHWEPQLLQVVYSEDPQRHAFFHAELKSTDHGDVWFSVDNEALEEISLGRQRPFAVWSAFPANGRTPQAVFQKPDVKYDVVTQRYEMDVTIKKDTTLQATTKVTVLPRLPARILRFILDPSLRVEQVTDFASTPLLFFQAKDPGDGPSEGNYLTVFLPAAAAPNQTLDLTFRYAGKRVVERVGSENFFCQSLGWYPSVGNDFIFRYPFDITLRVPKSYVAVAIGSKMEDRIEGDFQVTRWTTEVPVAVAGFAFGGYILKEEKTGKTTVQVYANRNADDIWKNLGDFLSGSSMPGPGVPDPMDPDSRDLLRSGDPTRGVGMQSLQPARLASEMVAEVANSLRVFEKYFGPYPFNKLAVSNIPWTYGQGWPSLLYISALSFMDSTQRHQLGVRDHVRLTDYFRAHETSHQWWGHVVGWKSYHDQWLSEGFADFSGLLYTQFRSGREEYLGRLRTDRELLLNKDAEAAVYDAIGPIYAGIRLNSGKHGGYSVLVYQKGGWVLHMLRMMLFNPREKEADTQFMRMMQDFTKTYFNQPASSDDFKRIAEKYMTPAMNVDGRNNLDWFFNQWVYGTGIPHYEVSYTVSPLGSGSLLKGTIRQSRVPPTFIMPVPLYAYQGKKVTRLGWLNVTGPETPFEIELPFAIDKISINEWEDVLCTVSYSK